ncbi:extensin family protein [Elstera litoralis]|uniref:extensin family protein n=1 Tax=Elstera litoralis TaxID=552518 RepID=UPI001E3FE507|nr:extensin family protein [Elstera litoralis]
MTEGVKLQRSTLVLSRPTVVTCDLAYAIARFEFEILQPLAEELFKKEVKRVDHVGSYNCRGIRNNRARLSEHAKGRAIDIIGVELTDGTRIRVEADWADKGPKGQFLRRAAKSACGLFSVVLGPNADRDHRDHLHLDVGPQRYCGA